MSEPNQSKKKLFITKLYKNIIFLLTVCDHSACVNQLQGTMIYDKELVVISLDEEEMRKQVFRGK